MFAITPFKKFKVKVLKMLMHLQRILDAFESCFFLFSPMFNSSTVLSKTLYTNLFEVKKFKIDRI